MAEERARPPEPALDLKLIRERISRHPGREGPAHGPRAAVAAVLRDTADGPEVLLIRRAERDSDPWSGHLAFPGGREEPGDTDLLETAVRETMEEIALDLRRQSRALGRLDALSAVARGRPTGMTITPFVFELTEPPVLKYNADEVSEALWVPLAPLMTGRWATTMPYELDGHRLELPAHKLGGHLLWGLTYRMLESLFSRLRRQD